MSRQTRAADSAYCEGTGAHQKKSSQKEYSAWKALESKECMLLQIEVSTACKGLVRGMLRTDPDKRMSLQEIISNPWFQHDLPSGAMAMNDFYSNCTPLPQEVPLPPTKVCTCVSSCVTTII
jgi:hypothetical protein